VKLPRDLHGSDAAKALIRLGFERQRQSGSHLILRRAGRTVVVPQHRPLKPRTLRGILEQAGVTLEELLQHL
jgi:predicted RNA binding protein YcfA (HicA-like mRNA interferase family)